MYNTKRIELIVKDWFKLKTGLELSDETISQMVADITETKQCDIHGVGNFAFLVQDKNTLLNHGLFSSEEKAKKYINGNTNYAIQKCDIA